MQKYHYIFSEGSRVNQITCAILINLTVFAYGASIGWMSPMGLLLQSEESPRGEPISDNELSWMASVAYLSAIPMNYLMAFMGDRIGRKKTLIFMSITFATLWAIKLCSTDTWALITARALVGVSMAGCYVTAPVYIKEISEDCIRGLLGSLAILSHTTGNLFGYIIGDLLRYNTVLWVCLALPVLHIVLFLSMPESPSYLIKTGKHEEAANVVAWLRCRNVTDTLVQGELERIKKEQTNDENSNDVKIKALFEDKILCRAFRIAMMLSFVRELCGVTLIINFAGEIFAMSSEKVFSALTPNQQAMLLGVVQTAGSVLASSLVERSGRKPLLLITSVVSMVSMCCLGSWFLAKNFGIVSMTWMPIASTCLCIFSDAAGLLPISIVVTCDIFSYKYRGTVLAITMATACFADFLLMLLFKPFVNYLGIYTVFYFFSGVCLTNAVYVLLVIPETKQKNLEEIYEKLKTKKERQKDTLSGVRTEVEVKT